MTTKPPEAAPTNPGVQTARQLTAREPRVGELIYGCYHVFGACGFVAEVGKHVTDDGMDHWWVTDSWHDRTIRAKREPNGLLYEVELVQSHD